MFKYLKPISISLSPNTEKDDIFLALRAILRPWKWKISANQRFHPRPSAILNPRKSALEMLEEGFRKYFNVNYAFSFNSGRSSFLAILKSLDLNNNDEVLLQAFTCNAVVNPILWAGLKPVFVDCDENTFNIDLEDLKRKITPKSKAIIAQHTFGSPADLEEILEICQKNNIILIEDCAHSLGATYKEKKVGTFGKAAFFSFGRDKVISSVYGGMVITNDDFLAKKLKRFQEEISYPSYFWIFQQLLHPLLMNLLILPTYRILGKYLLVFFQSIGLLSKAIHPKEKRGEKPDYFPQKLPNALAILALYQFKKLKRFINHRRKITDFYFEKLKDSLFELPKIFSDQEQILLRFSIKHPQVHQIIKEAQKKNLLLGDWYFSPVAPQDTELNKMKYRIGSCPKAEKLSKITINLPTHINISLKKAKEIIDFLQMFSNKNINT